VQNELVMMLAARHRNLCVVVIPTVDLPFPRGDVRNILQFELRFPTPT